MTRRFLLLTYAFPPMAAPEAVLSAKRMGNLPGVEVDVVTIRPFRSWMGDDDSLDAYVHEHFGEVVRIEAGAAGRLPLGRLGPLVDAPDAFRLFNARLEKAVSRCLALGEYDAVVTWGQFHSAHLVGRRVRRLTKAPWIAHISDPWMENPYVRMGWLARRRNAALERSVIHEASLVTVTSQQTQRLLRRRYPRLLPERIVVLPHAYDPSLYPATQTVRHEGVVVRHLGAFYGPRTPEPLFRALKRLSLADPDLLADVTVELIGPLPRAMLDGAYRALPEGLVRVFPPVPYSRSLELMASADLLLVVDAPAAESVFLPSKLIDYVGAKRPILALTPEGASAELVDALGGHRADPVDERACASAIAAALRAVRLPRASDPDDVAGIYRADRVGQAFLEAVDQVVHGGS